MNNKKLKRIVLITFITIVLSVTIIINFCTDLNAFNKGIFTGIIAGLLGFFISMLIRRFVNRKHPEIIKQQEIIAKEERTIMIRDKAGSKAFTINIVSSSIVIFALALANVDMSIILIIWGIFMANTIIYIILLLYYNKKY